MKKSNTWIIIAIGALILPIAALLAYGPVIFGSRASAVAGASSTNEKSIPITGANRAAPSEQSGLRLLLPAEQDLFAGRPPAQPGAGAQVAPSTNLPYAEPSDPLRSRIRSGTVNARPGDTAHTYTGTGDPLSTRVKRP